MKFVFEPQNTEEIISLGESLADICQKLIRDSDHCPIISDTVGRALVHAVNLVSEDEPVVADRIGKFFSSFCEDCEDFGDFGEDA